MRLTFLLPLACDTGNGKKGVRESEGSKEPCEIDNTFDRLKEHPVGKRHSHIAHGNTEDEEVKWPSRIFLRTMEEVEWGKKVAGWPRFKEGEYKFMKGKNTLTFAAEWFF